VATWINSFLNRIVLAGRTDTSAGADVNEVVVDATGALAMKVTGSTARVPAHGDAVATSITVDALLRALRTSDNLEQALSAELDAASKAILRFVDAAPWAYNATFGDKHVAVTRGVPVSNTSHSAVVIAAGAMGTEVSVPMKGYKQAIIFVKSDQVYDLSYRVSDPVVNGMQLVLVSAQAVTGADARSHPLIAGGVWLFGDTLKIQPKNTGAVPATMTVTVYLIP
jgi:hypothetical protein